MGEHEIWDGAGEDNSEALGINAPAHDAQRVRPNMFTDMLDLGRAAIPGAQHDCCGAVAEQTDGDNVLEARVAGRMGFRSDVMRVPVFGLGCARRHIGLVDCCAAGVAIPVEQTVTTVSISPAVSCASASA